MPFFEYMLLAVLGSAAPVVTPGSAATPTLGADAIVQPTGGAVGEGGFNSGTRLFGQTGGGTPGRAHKGGKHYSKTHRRHHRRGTYDYNHGHMQRTRGQRSTVPQPPPDSKVKQ